MQVGDFLELLSKYPLDYWVRLRSNEYESVITITSTQPTNPKRPSPLRIRTSGGMETRAVDEET
jgi:hypothetical protein